MFLKDLTIPESLLKAEALEGRIFPQHESMSNLKKMIKTLRSGYNGEKTINYYLSQIPPHKYHILHDIRLPLANTFFQIDAILLSPKIILFLDAKNHSGTLHIQKDQMIQEYLEAREVYENPVTQAERHKIQLRYWLNAYQFPPIRIEYLVVITKSQTEVKISTDYPEARAKICKAHDLLRKIEEIEASKIAPHKQSIERIGSLLLKDNTPLKMDILQMLHIKGSDILPGVHCPNCLFLPMNYHRKKWICPSCQFISQDAHLRAINDYFLLMKASFTNPELRNFLHIPSSRATTYLLTHLNFPHAGEKRGRIYSQP